MTSTIDEIIDALEPAAWRHPEVNWVHTRRSAILVHCWNDGPYPMPLYTRDQLASLLTTEREAREKAEAVLREIIATDPVDNMLDPQRPARLAVGLLGYPETDDD